MLPINDLWNKHEKLAWYWAFKIGQRFFYRSEELIGSLWLHMADCARLWDEDKGSKFGTYYSTRVFSKIIQEFIRFDCERRDLIHYQSNSKDEDFHNARVVKEAYEADYYLYRVPPDDEAFDEILKCFPTTDDLWSFIRGCLSKREADVIELHYRNGCSMKYIGDGQGVTKQRIYQIHERALEKVSVAMGTLAKWERLFKKPA